MTDAARDGALEEEGREGGGSASIRLTARRIRQLLKASAWDGCIHVQKVQGGVVLALSEGIRMGQGMAETVKLRVRVKGLGLGTGSGSDLRER